MGGCGLMRNDEQAMAYYEKACTGGEMDMCNNLGVCYYEGRCGVAKDDAEAAKLYEKACRGGYSGACYNLDLIKN
jgi:TPR repeat protein